MKQRKYAVYRNEFSSSNGGPAGTFRRFIAPYNGKGTVSGVKSYIRRALGNTRLLEALWFQYGCGTITMRVVNEDNDQVVATVKFNV